ncbi:MAG: phosphatidylglycerol lysyltransferase domain-containing protein [Acidaminococcaceae bacterium]
MLKFKHIALEDKPIFDRYFSEQVYNGSECTFTNLFIWRSCYDINWTINHEALLIKVTRNNVTFLLPPFGGSAETLPLIFNELKLTFVGQQLEIRGIYEETITSWQKNLPDIVAFTEDRDNWDYVYLQEKLATLAGRKYHSKKNHLNAFKKDQPDYLYEEITPANIEECIAFADLWCERRIGNDASLGCEFCAIKEALRNMTILKICGGLIRINGKVEAFTFGEKLNQQMAVIHVEKANPDIRGLYTAINQEFCQNAWSAVTYINREEDMGIEGLRKAKESYNPELMVKKYITVLSN